MKQLYTSIFTAALLFTYAGNAQCTPPVITGTTAPTAPICAGTSATFTATSDSGTLAWFNAATGGTQVGTGGTFNSPPLSAAASYWVEAQGELILGTPQSGGGKTTHGNSGSAVAAASNPWGLVFNATQPFILNSVEVYLSSGTPGDIVVQLKNSNFDIIATTTVSAPAGGTNSNPVTFVIPLNFDIPVGTGYRLVADSGPAMIRDFSSGVTFPYPIGTVGSITQGTINDSNTNSGLYYLFYNWNFTPYTPCASARQEVSVNVNVTSQPTANAHTFCGAATVAELEATGTDLKWYAGSTGGTQLEDDTALTTTTYYVSQTIDGCESTRKSVPVTITPLPAAPVVPSQSFCGSATVEQLNDLGANFSWFANETDTTPLTGETALATNTYYVSQTVNSCESTRTEVSVTINTVPDAPEADTHTFCGTATVAQLTADGDNLTWYATETAANSLSNDTPLSTHTYYVSQSAGSCESGRTPVQVIVNDIPDAPTANANIFCNNGTAGELEAEGDNLQWYISDTEAGPMDDEDVLTNGTYYVSQTVNGCESTRTEVSVSITVVAEPVAEDEQDFTAGQTIADLDVTGTGLIWYDADGNELDPSTVLVDGTTYFVRQVIDGCEGPLTSVTANEALSISNNTLPGLSFYPNPVTDKLMLTHSSPITDATVYDILGQKLMVKNFNTTDAVVDFSALSAGTYIVSVTSGITTATIKVVKK
jgi:hypothetical protein